MELCLHRSLLAAAAAIIEALLVALAHRAATRGAALEQTGPIAHDATVRITRYLSRRVRYKR